MTKNESAPSDLLCRISYNAKQMPDKIALTFLTSGSNGGKQQKQMSFSEVVSETDNIASLILEKGLKAGDRAVLVFPPSLDFMLSFLACLKVGVVAVPVFPPNPARRETLEAFSIIVKGSDAKFALTNTFYDHAKKIVGVKESFQLKKARTSWPELTWIKTDTTSSKKQNALNISALEDPSPPSLAFLQYTSGSTSSPKGVMITHANLSHNLTIITRELKASKSTVVVSWLPQYHDMGLIGAYLGTLYAGGSGYYMSPLTFLQRPIIWLEAVSKYGGTHLQCPNFALKLTARKWKGETLDLSSVKHILNGAEPVDVEGMQFFYETFGKFNLPQGVIFPTYGLAEHTVFVCSGGTQVLTVEKEALEMDRIVKEGPKGEGMRTVVGCGYPSRHSVDVRIVSNETCEEFAEDTVGEIWINSPSKAMGYFGKPVITKTQFNACLSNAEVLEDDDGSNGYLRTGDLGFLHNKELFICGRLKDLIIVAGRNYYPQDIEMTAENESNLFRPGCSAAFSVSMVDSDEEKVILLMELRDPPKPQDIISICEPLLSQIVSTIKHEHSLTVSQVIFLQPRTIPKTTSGKISRSRCRKAFQDNMLKVIYENSSITKVKDTSQMKPLEIDEAKMDFRNTPSAEILHRLKSDIGEMAMMDPGAIDVRAPLTNLMDSMALAEMNGKMKFIYATEVSDEYLFMESTTIEKLAEVIKLGYAPDEKEGNGMDTSANIAMGRRNKGLSAKLGCPPGVYCTVM